MAPDDATPDPTRSDRTPPSRAPRPAAPLPPPAEDATPVPAIDPAEESARQTAATVQSVSRLEEAN